MIKTNFKYFLAFYLFSLLSIPCASYSQQRTILPDSTRWVDSVLASLNTSQKIAQLMMVRAYSNKDEKHYSSIDSLIIKYQIGGLVFFQGGPVAQAKLTNRWQKLSNTPLLIGMDAENGLGMRLDSTFSYPDNFTLGALSNDTLIYKLGKRIGQQCKRLGVTINFAPVADVNSNSLNPVINSRSYGEDPYAVAKKARAFLIGMQSEGIIGCMKHFPGHGDTETDSHHNLPIITKTYNQLTSNELVPFTKTLDIAKSVMIGHLYVPAIDTTKDLPASLSKITITNLLKNELGYNGLIISDALDMKGVTNSFKPGEIELKALAAGNHILLLPTDIEKSIQTISQAIDSGLYDLELLNIACKKTLAYKYFAYKNSYKPIPINNLNLDLCTASDTLLVEQLIDDAITLLKNDGELIPITNFSQQLTVIPFFDSENNLAEEFKLLMPTTVIYPNEGHDTTGMKESLRHLNPDGLVIVVLNLPSIYKWKDYGLKTPILDLIDSIASRYNSILILKGNPYGLTYLKNLNDFKAIMVSYSNKKTNNALIINKLLGATPFCGRLPVTVSKQFPIKTGLKCPTQDVLVNVRPETLGISSSDLKEIDKIVIEGIRKNAYPGCQVLLAKDGKIFYNKCFGSKTYEDTIRIKPDYIYDIASVTKIAATTLSAMRLFDQGNLLAEDRIEKYLPYMKHKGKHKLTIQDIMAHQAGFEPWIPFYNTTLKTPKSRATYYKDSQSKYYSIKLTDKLFLRSDYPDTIRMQIAQCKLPNKGHYVYSDLGFILLKDAIEKASKKSIDQYTDSVFFRPMGMVSTAFLPLNNFPIERIVPTEFDTILRNQLLCGQVNDKVAALFGGISGHAGLFSNAFDMAKFMQMLLWDGEYAGKRYLKPSTIKYFTSRVSERSGNRRGLGFDKPPIVPIKDGPVCKSASPSSFGHSGYTGTYVWADPTNGLVFVFLSNRVYPHADNTLISKLNIRTRIHQKAYELIEKANSVKL